MKKRVFILILSSLAVLFIYLLTLQPSLTRNWEVGMETLADVSVNENMVVIENFRDWRYTTDKNIASMDFKKVTYDVDKLERVWFMIEPFSLFDKVAHTYLTFDFQDAEPAVISIEARREKGEKHSALKGMVRGYELIYIWGSERDLTGRRVLVEETEVFMYPLDISQGAGKQLFLEIVKETERLEKTPKYYNTITANCTNLLAQHANKVNSKTIPTALNFILPGYSPELLYRQGFVKKDLSLEDLKMRNNITQLVKDHYDSTEFSKEIRKPLFQ